MSNPNENTPGYSSPIDRGNDPSQQNPSFQQPSYTPPANQSNSGQNQQYPQQNYPQQGNQQYQQQGFHPGTMQSQQQQMNGFIQSNQKSEAAIAHLLYFSSFLIGPLWIIVSIIFYIVKKDEQSFVSYHAKEALNFSLTILLAIFVSLLLVLVIIGIFTLLALVVIGFIFPIIAALAANKGEYYKYPICIRFIN